MLSASITMITQPERKRKSSTGGLNLPPRSVDILILLVSGVHYIVGYRVHYIVGYRVSCGCA